MLPKSTKIPVWKRKKVYVRHRRAFHSLNPRNQLRLKTIPFVPEFSPFPVKFTTPLRSSCCFNSNPEISLSLIKLQQQWSHSAPWGKENNAAVGTLEHHHPWHLPFFSFLIACRSQNATQLCILSALRELTHANVLFPFVRRGCIMKGRPVLVLHWHSAPTSKHMKY